MNGPIIILATWHLMEHLIHHGFACHRLAHPVRFGHRVLRFACTPG